MKWMLTFLILIIFTGCQTNPDKLFSKQQEDNPSLTWDSKLTLPPDPKMVIGEKRINYKLTGYSWKFVKAEGIHPLDAAKKMKKDEVTANSKLKINFTYKPLNLNAFIYTDNRPIEIKINENGTLDLGNKKGIYVYELRGKWKEGSASYVFKIEIK